MSRKITIDFGVITRTHVAIAAGAFVCAAIGYGIRGPSEHVIERTVTKWRTAVVTRTNPYFCEPLHKYLPANPETMTLSVPLGTPTISPEPKQAEYQIKAWSRIRAAEVKAQADLEREEMRANARTLDQQLKEPARGYR